MLRLIFGRGYVGSTSSMREVRGLCFSEDHKVTFGSCSYPLLPVLITAVMNPINQSNRRCLVWDSNDADIPL